MVPMFKGKVMEKLRWKFKKIGRNVTIYNASIIYPENISIGDEVVIDDFCFLTGREEGIEIGNFSHIVAGTILQGGGLLKIGDFCGIGHRSVILAASDDYHGEGFIGLKVLNEYRKLNFRPVTLKNHSHVGAGSIILPGVTLGEGCSIGAGSLVTKDMPEWTVCYGTPCKPIKDKPREKQLRMEKEFLEKYYDTVI